MKRVEITIGVPDGFEIDSESIDNIKSYLCYCFKVDHVNVDSWNLPDWTCSWSEQHNGIDPEIPF